MATVNETLRDAVISHQIDLQHYSNGEVARVLALLKRADADLAARLSAAIDKLGGESFTAKAVEASLLGVRELLAELYGRMGDQMQTGLAEFGQHELDFQDGLFRATLPTAVVDQVGLAKVTFSQVREIAFRRPFQGRLLSEWVKSLEKDAATRIRDSIRMGMVEGLTTAEIVQKVRGTRAEGFKDGILEISRRNAEAVVRTAISHVANSARDTYYDANADLIQEVRWLSTLDGRTSAACRLRDGKAYTNDTHRPIGHTVPWGAGPGRLHWQCRSTSYPVLKIWSELGIDAKDLPPATRASMNGQVPADVTYADWLDKQSAARQDEILGPTRAKLFRDGGLQLDQFYNDKGKLLTLDQLQERSASAFREAGL